LRPISVLGAAVAVFLLYVSALPLHAHKVNIFAWVEGKTIHTESYFPDGKAVQNGDISVLDSRGNLLLTGTTDSDGLFSFPIPKRDDLTIVLDASMGHRNTYTITAGELGPESTPESGGKEAETSVERSSGTEQAPPKNVEAMVTLEEIRAVVGEEVSRQLEPLAAKLSRLEKDDRVTMSEVFAGIGYILGLMGLVMFFKSKMKR
jgi:nickel transport protein